MLRFNQLSPTDKQKRYRILVKYPALFILILFLSFRINYAIYVLAITILMIINLFVEGILNNRTKYKTFFLYSIFLLLTTMVSTFILTPALVTVILEVVSLSLSDFYHYLILVLVSVLIIYLFWFVYIVIQNKISGDHSMMWKWRVTGLFSPMDLKFNH